ncbi:MAG: PAS domain S-box protein [Actinomycetota bacterium]
MGECDRGTGLPGGLDLTTTSDPTAGDRRETIERAAAPLQAIPLEWGALLEAMPDAVIASDADGRILFANSQFETLMGYERGELVGRPIEVLVPASLAPVHADHRRFYYEHPRTRTMGVASDIRARRKDGVEFPVDISLSTIETLRGTLVVSAVRDLTQREKQESTARQHARVKAVAMDRERLGQGLLDHVVRQMFEAAMGIQVAALAAPGDAKLQAKLAEVEDAIDRAIKDLRGYVFDMGTGEQPEQPCD